MSKYDWLCKEFTGVSALVAKALGDGDHHVQLVDISIHMFPPGDKDIFEDESKAYVLHFRTKDGTGSHNIRVFEREYIKYSQLSDLRAEAGNKALHKGAVANTGSVTYAVLNGQRIVASQENWKRDFDRIFTAIGKAGEEYSLLLKMIDDGDFPELDLRIGSRRGKFFTSILMGKVSAGSIGSESEPTSDADQLQGDA